MPSELFHGHAVKLILIITVAILPEKKSCADNDAVTLLSTLRQGSLCPGDGGATFTCTCRGTDLTWIVGGRMMSYNANSRVGAVRSNAESDETAILLRVENIGGNGLANRVSVLTIRERPHATQPITVQCHNGSFTETKTQTFWRKVAGDLQAPVLLDPELPNIDDNRLGLNWTLPQLDTQIRDVAYYAVQVEQALPMLVKNTTTTLFISPETETQNISVSITAVDMCQQTGGKKFTIEIQPPATTPELTTITTTSTTTTTNTLPVTTHKPQVLSENKIEAFSSAKHADCTMMFICFTLLAQSMF